MNEWTDREGWRKLRSGEGCPLCLPIQSEDECRSTTAELEEAETTALMKDMRAVSGALQRVTEAVKINVKVHGNTVPQRRAHFYPRHVGDRFEGGSIDRREPWPPALSPDEFRNFVGGLRTALAEV